MYTAPVAALTFQDSIGSFEAALLEYANHNNADFMRELTNTGNYNDDIKGTLKGILDSFKANSSW